ncbi:hypothetical protein [Tissierella sp.]|uniref:hypothetical protein n=1 Tax=Tissierella sp. TaxID=41274 RepID=UPI0030623AAA
MNDINLIKDFFKNNLRATFFIKGHLFTIENLNNEYVELQLHHSDVINDDDITLDNFHLFFNLNIIFYYDEFLDIELQELIVFY